MYIRIARLYIYLFLFSGCFEYTFLLKAIVNGQIYLGRAAPDDRHPSGGLETLSCETQSFKDDRELWKGEQMNSQLRDVRETLAFCLEEAGRVFQRPNPDKRLETMARHIELDMRKMQTTPFIMRNYRQFVVLKGPEDKIAQALPEGVRANSHLTNSTLNYLEYSLLTNG
jgi:hypothetical protein